MDRARWPELKEKFAQLFLSRTRAQWCELLEGTDVCFAPVLDMAEAPAHPHNRSRNTFLEIDGVVQPAPAPRFSRTTPEIGERRESDSAAILKEWGWSDAAIGALADKDIL
jgi:alpha-methylacyl-CoA racemase